MFHINKVLLICFKSVQVSPSPQFCVQGLLLCWTADKSVTKSQGKKIVISFSFVNLNVLHIYFHQLYLIFHMIVLIIFGGCFAQITACVLAL